MTHLWTLIAAYVLGSIPTGYLLVWALRGQDIRETGRGNIGATNVARTSGFRLGAVVLALDAAKGLLAVWLAGRVSGGSEFWMSVAALAVVLGNTFNIFMQFSGGKGFATASGALLYLAPLPTAALAAVFLGTTAATRHVSAGSIVAAFTAPLAVWLIDHPSWIKVLCVVLAAGLILWRHRDNMRRLQDGSETVLKLRR